MSETSKPNGAQREREQDRRLREASERYDRALEQLREATRELSERIEARRARA